MRYRDIPKNPEITLCDNCPAKKGEIFTAKLRGSSFRGRLIDEGENYNVDSCVFLVGNTIVANVQIANVDEAAAEQDAEVLTASFESNVGQCEKPDIALGALGLQVFCGPINRATDEFMKVNYPAE